MLDEYLHIMSDPAHMLAEITFILLIDVLFLGAMVPFIRRRIRKHDREVHGTTHERSNTNGR